MSFVAHFTLILDEGQSFSYTNHHVSSSRFNSFLSYLTDAVAVCKAKDAFDLVERHMLLDLYHISVELRRGTAENKFKLTN